MEYTLTYSEAVKGWVSFYSFQPDWMIGMNNYFYTFKGGNLYRHNVNAVRNNFYGTQYFSQLTSVFNDAPLENKLFKTINLEGDDAWAANLATDIQTTGFIDYSWFSKKEQSYFAFVRNSGTVPASPDQYPLRSLNGIGRSISVSGPNTAQIINFSINPLIVIGSIISIGDYVYYAIPPSTALVLAGQVTAINVDYPNGINRIVIDSTIVGAVYPVPSQTAYFLYIKNSVAESHGVLGHYCTFTLQNTNTDKVELFAAEADIMKSYP
jgi:hypothetical protein